MKTEFIRIKRRSELTGKEHTAMLPMTQAEFDAAMVKWNNGALIQHAFPNLTAAEREFLLTGSTPEEWDEIFGGGDD